MTISQLLVERLADVRGALLTWPSAQMWRRCLAVNAAFAACSLSLGFASGFLRPGLAEVSPTTFALLPVYLLLSPALLEELLFRVILLPRDTTRVSKLRLILISAAALSLFVVAHPLSAWLFRPTALSLFKSPVFLATAALLGAACTGVYLISKSLWPRVLLHWIAVLVWVILLGGNALIQPLPSQ